MRLKPDFVKEKIRKIGKAFNTKLLIFFAGQLCYRNRHRHIANCCFSSGSRINDLKMQRLDSYCILPIFAPVQDVCRTEALSR